MMRPSSHEHRVLLGHVNDWPAPGSAKYKGDITGSLDTIEFPHTSFGTGLKVESATYDPASDKTTVTFAYNGESL